MVSGRSLEAATALITGAFGAAVVVSSLDNGIGWSRAGVDAGTFPFLTGVIVVIGSLCNLASGALAGSGVAISRVDLRRVVALFIPAAIFIALIPVLGMYLASAGYVFATIALPKHKPLLQALAIAVATPLALYVVFERLFHVTLPHGALLAAVGF